SGPGVACNVVGCNATRGAVERAAAYRGVRWPPQRCSMPGSAGELAYRQLVIVALVEEERLAVRGAQRLDLTHEDGVVADVVRLVTAADELRDGAPHDGEVGEPLERLGGTPDGAPGEEVRQLLLAGGEDADAEALGVLQG